MTYFRGAKLLLVASVTTTVLALMPLAAFADGDLGDDGSADAPAISDTTPPITNLTEALDTLQYPLRELVSDCNPGASAVSVQALPDSTSDDPPTSLLVSFDEPNGNVVDAKIDQTFVSSCVAQTTGRASASARADAAMVLKDAAAALAIG